MKDYLTQELGLTEAAAEGILERFSLVEQERTEAQNALQEAQNALTGLEAEYAAHRREAAICRALSDAGAKNLTAAGALIDKNALTEDETGFSGLREQVEKIKGDCPYLFRGADLSGGMRHAPRGGTADSFTQFARAGAKLKG